MKIFGKISGGRILKGAFFLVIVVFAFIGAWNLTNRGIKAAANLSGPDLNIEEGGKKMEGGSKKKKASQYSFYKDGDRDGLSDGWEYVFGTDPKKPDTDGDGYSDKKEAKDGYDPLRAWEAKLDQRKAKNLSIDYYLWAQKRDIKSPTLEFNSRIREFAQSKGLIKLEEVPPSFLKVDSSESPQDYLEKLQSVPLPRAAFDYQTLASGYRGKDSTMKNKLQDLLSRVELALAGTKKINPPPEVRQIHKKHLKVLINFREFLKDLKKARRDPVQIKINLFKSGELIKEAVEAEELKRNINS